MYRKETVVASLSAVPEVTASSTIIDPTQCLAQANPTTTQPQQMTMVPCATEVACGGADIVVENTGDNQENQVSLTTLRDSNILST